MPGKANNIPDIIYKYFSSTDIASECYMMCLSSTCHIQKAPVPHCGQVMPNMRGNIYFNETFRYNCVSYLSLNIMATVEVALTLVNSVAILIH